MSATPARSLARFAAGASAALLALSALTGCGSSSTQGEAGTSGGSGSTGSTAAPGTAPAAPALLPPGEGKTQYPLTLKTPWGETTLEKRPTRIAAMGAGGGDVELLAAMGATPVAAPKTIERSVWTTQALPTTIESVIDADPDAGPPVEKIAEAEPDLIVITGTDLSGGAYDKLKAIAPVLAVTDKRGLTAPGDSWRNRITPLGAALDLPGAAAKVVSDHDAHLAKIRSENPQFAGKTATYAILYGGDYGLAYRSPAGSDTEKLLTAIGFAPNPLAKKFSEENDAVSLEQLGLLDADVLLFSDNTEDDGGKEMSRITGSKLWQNLPVVKDKRAVVFANDGESYTFAGKKNPGNIAWAVSMSGPLADVWAADRLAPMLRSALK